jgi:hypothetical protein
MWKEYPKIKPQDGFAYIVYSNLGYPGKDLGSIRFAHYFGYDLGFRDPWDGAFKCEYVTHFMDIPDKPEFITNKL